MPASASPPATDPEPRLPTVAETMKHPAFPTAIWNLTPDTSGLAPVAVGRGGPFNLHYEVHGTGPIKLIFIMGLGGLKTAWQRQTLHFGHLSTQYSVLLLDNRGMGSSDKPLLRYSTSEMARDIIDLLVHLSWLPSTPPLPDAVPRTLHVVGLSLGGMIAQELACLIPTAISTLSLCCTAAAVENTTSFTENAAARLSMLTPKPLDATLAASARQLFAPGWIEAPDTALLPSPTETSKCLPPSPPVAKGLKEELEGPKEYKHFDTNGRRYVAQEIYKRLLTPGAFGIKGFLLQLIAAGWHHKSAAQLAEMGDRIGRERILVLHGTEDGMITVHHGRKLIQMIRPGEGIIVEGMGHAPLLERTQWFNELIEKRCALGERLDGRA